MKSKPDVFFENYKIFKNKKKGLWIGDFLKISDKELLL